MLCCLIDSRRAAAAYLRISTNLVTERESEYIVKIAENCQAVSDMVSAFRDKVCRSSTCDTAYNTVKAFGVFTPALRQEQIRMLEKALILDEESCRLAESMLPSM